MPTRKADSFTIRSALLPFVALAVIAVAAPVVIAHHYGALDIPRSDDWSYLHTLFLWHRTGHGDFNDWVSMTLVGQVVISAPIVGLFGESITAISIAWAIIGFAGLLAVVMLARFLGRPVQEGFLVALAIAACPLWGALAPTFMTDVPAFVFEMFALALGALALKRASTRLLIGAAGVGFVAIAIRQYAAIPVGALLVSAGWTAFARGDRRRVRTIVGIIVGLAAAVIILLLWWSSVPNGKVLGPRIPNIESVRLTIANAANFLRLAGAVLFPVVVFARPARVARRAFGYDRVVALWTTFAMTGLLVVGYALASTRPFIGNYFDAHGVLSNDIIPGARPPIMPTIVFDGLVLLATLSAIVLALACVPFVHDLIGAVRTRTAGHPDPLVLTLGLTVAGFAVAYELATFLRMGFSERTAVFDRYALPVLPLIGLLFLVSTARRATDEPAGSEVSRSVAPRIPTLIALAAITLIGFAYTAESASFDGTRWKLAETVVARGYSPLQIHAGYEWEGWFHGRGPLTSDSVSERQQLRAAYFQGMCVTISISPKRLPKDPIAVATSNAPTRRPATIVAARNTRSCDIPPASGSTGEKPIHSIPASGG
jgi:uncharacterized membrane protein YuzA (DUF378 family)